MRLLLYLLIVSSAIISAVSACRVLNDVTNASGQIEYPIGLRGSYEPNLDLCWTIKVRGAIAIKFINFDLEKRHDYVGLYDGALKDSGVRERFRLISAEQGESEYWLTGQRVTVRFQTDGNIQMTGFRLIFRNIPVFNLPVSGASAALEIISSARSGIIESHVQVTQAQNYSNNLLQAWTIHAAASEIVKINFARFSTERNYDFLRVFTGAQPNVRNESLSTQVTKFSGSLGSKIHYSFFGSVTFVFKSDASNSDKGFQFEFSVTKTEYNVRAVYTNWTGSYSSGTGGGMEQFSLVASPPDRALEAVCRLDNGCYNSSTAQIRKEISNSSTTETRLQFRIQAPKSVEKLIYCIGGIVCRVSWTTEAYRTVEKTLSLPYPDPSSIEIQFLQPATWLEAGVILFVAGSKSVCPRVRHRCQLKSFNYTIEAKPIKLTVSPAKSPSCLSSSVRTHFAISVPQDIDIANVSLAVVCHLLDGNTFKRLLPRISAEQKPVSEKFSRTGSWERSLLITTWLLVALICILLIGFRLLKARQNRQSSGFNLPRRGGLIFGKTKRQSDITNRGNSYVSTPPAVDVNEVYIT